MRRELDNASLLSDSMDAVKKANQTRYEFILIELDLGLTFSQIADSSGDKDKSSRNLEYATKARDTALRFLNETPLTETMRRTVQTKFEELDASLKNAR